MKTTMTRSRNAGLAAAAMVLLAGCSATRMQRFEDRAAVSYAESEQWSEQAAAVRADAQSIERELGQPFFAWLAEREGTDGRPIGAGGAMRIASPQTPEDAEALREHAAAFIAERFPVPAGPDPAAVAGRPAFEAARGDFGQAHGPAAGMAHAAWAADVREHAAGAGAPGPGVAIDSAAAGRGDVEAELAAREADRHTRDGSVRSDIGAGRAAIATENVRPLREHATEGVPFVGEWLAGIGGDDRIVGVHDRAVKTTLAWVEKHAVQSRPLPPGRRAMPWPGRWRISRSARLCSRGRTCSPQPCRSRPARCTR